MQLLLDTHALLWWWLESSRLQSSAFAAVADRQNAIYVSAVTGWEIATKVRKGQLQEIRSHMDRFEEHVASDGFSVMPVTLTHGLKAGALEGRHKDPFDRLIAAQALIGDMTVITRDPEIAAFGCKVLW